MAGVIPPLTITDAMVTSSTAAEPGTGETTWTTGATFALADKAILGSVTSTVTISNASPAVVTWATNGIPDGTAVYFTTTGTLPTGLTASTVYYVVNRASGSFQVSESVDGAAISTSSAGSGTHTAHAQLHRIYESQVGANSGNPPAIDDGTKWLDVGPTNRWAMFDTLRNTRTWATSPLTVVLTPGQRIDALFLGGLVANSVTVSITSGGVSVYSATVDLNDRFISNWYDYFFKAFSTKPSVLKLDLPPYTNAVITVTITRTSGLVGCGALVLGGQFYIGRTLHGAEAEARNFSKVDRDEFGNAEMVKRRSIPSTSSQIVFDKTNSRAIQDIVDALNAVPAVWYGIDEDDEGYFEPLLILGFYKTMRLNLAHPNEGVLTAQLEEV